MKEKPVWIVSSRWDGMFTVVYSKDEAKLLRRKLQADGDIGVYIKKKHSGSYLSDYR